MKLEELERRLRNDLIHEAMAWGGRLLLHRDISVQKPNSPSHAEMGSSQSEDDVTTNEDVNPDNAIAAFWDQAGIAIGIGKGSSAHLSEPLAQELSHL